MGKRVPGGDEFGKPWVDEDVALGAASAWCEVHGTFNIFVTGAGSGVVECSVDGGVTAIPCGAFGTILTLVAPFREQMLSREDGLLHRVKHTVGAGLLHVRISQ